MTTNLRSKAYARILDLVSEGEIEGLVNGAKGIYLDGTPLQNPDNTFNFENVTFDTRVGTNAQTYIPGTPGVENETLVSTEVKNSASVVRTVSNADVNAVRVTVSVPALYKQKDNGDLEGRTVGLAIDVQPSGGSYTTILSPTIEGKATSKYQRSYRVNLTGSAPWNIRVRRITADTTDPKIQNKTFWDSFTEIIDTKLRYPNSALVSIKFDASTFNGIPTRAYDLKLRKIQIPSNYNPITRVYTGTWNGTFQTAWSDNPAWCFYDLVTNSRYGLGSYISAAQVDKWALYSIGQYCDQLVDDGFGGTEPRFTCNLYLQSRAEAYKVVQDLASCFRSMVYWASGSLTLSQDAPSDPVALFTQSNVIDGLFSYSGSSAKARHTVALVTWNDPDDLYAQKVEYVEDIDGIARYGVVQTEVVAVGCTSRGQAARVGRWLLFSERYESETVTFQTGIEGAVARPGQVIKVADASRAGVRLGGRVRSATTTAVTMDSPVTLGASTWTLYAVLPDGSVGQSLVFGASGNTINLTTALAAAPQAGAQWIMSASTVEAQTFRVLTVTEQDNGLVEITALKHYPDKYGVIEDGLVLQERDITSITPVPDAPTNLVLSESLYTYQAEVRAKVSIGWQNVNGASSYRVLWSKDGSNFIEAITSVSDYDILDITPGVFAVRVYAVGPTGKESATYASDSITALGKTAPPANVTGLASVLDPTIGITLTWDKVADLDLDGYEIKDGATVLAIAKTTSFKVGLLPTGTKTYTVRALDTSGNYSATAASLTVTISAAGAPTVSSAFAGENVVLTWPAVQGSLATESYEIRYGASFAAGTSLGTISGTSFTTKGTWSGARTFWVAARDVAGFLGTAGSVVVTISQAAAPSISSSFAGEDVILNWGAVTGSLPTAQYEVRYGASFATGTFVSAIKGTSLAVKGTWVGARTFWVAAQDSAGFTGTAGSVVVTILAANAPTMSHAFTGENISITWSDVVGSLPTDQYELRYGDTWAGGTSLGFIKSTSFLSKAQWVGLRKFMVAAIDTAGNVGGIGERTINVNAPAAVSIIQEVIDNNVLLKWSDGTATLPLDYYELRKGATWAGATVIGRISARFSTIFESASGTYKYWVAGVDVAGNVGAQSYVDAFVNQPPDYALQFNQDSTFPGTKSNFVGDSGLYYTPVDTAETWQAHFTSRGWTTLQDQVNAGYPIYAMPTTSAAYYEETIDYGTVLAATKITATLSYLAVAGSVTVTPKISVRKLTTDPWIDYNSVSSVFVTDFRYVKVRFDFTSSGGDDLITVTGLNVRFDVKLKNDAGTITANSGDSGGTTVNFTVTFVDVQSITVTPKGTTARIAIYDFVDVPNPTSFKVLLFDTAGNRVSGDVSWSVKGV